MAFTGPDTVVIPRPQYERTPPPLALGAAYSKAVLALGTATNQYYCRSVTCLKQLTTFVSSEGYCDSGWTFLFSNTNGASKNVYVYFNKAATVQVESTPSTGF